MSSKQVNRSKKRERLIETDLYGITRDHLIRSTSSEGALIFEELAKSGLKRRVASEEIAEKTPENHVYAITSSNHIYD